VELETGEIQPPHVLLAWRDSVWVPIYREGNIEGASQVNRNLRTLMLSRDDVLIASGDGVYRWDGEDKGFLLLENHPSGLTFRCSFRSFSGNMIIGGDAAGMRWSDGESWFGVHLAAPMQPAITSVAMIDTLIVLSGADGFNDVLLHGSLTRMMP
jgi:hypothetical protein